MNIKNIFIKVLLIVTPLLLVTTSCSEENGSISKKGEKELEMWLMTGGEAITRAGTIAGTSEENQIKELTLLVFNGSGDDAEFQYSRYAWRKTEGKNTFRTTLKHGNNLTIYFAANASSVLNSLGADVLKEENTWGEIKKELIMRSPGAIAPASTGLPMWGMVTGKDISDKSTNDLGIVKLIRSVASANVKVSDEDFILEEGVLVYAADQGYLHYDPTVLTGTGNAQVSRPVCPDNMAANLEITKVAESNKIMNTFYMFDNDAPITAVAGNTKKQTKLILKGKLKDADKSTYYPLSFMDKNTNEEAADTKLQVTRNTQYFITITKVNGEGYEDIDDAKKGEDVNFNYEISEWVDKSDDYITIDGDKYISFKHPSPDQNDIIIKLGRLEGSTEILKINTNYTAADFKMRFGSTGDFVASPIQTDRFKIEFKEDPVLGMHFKFTALQNYNPDGGNQQLFTVLAGRKKITMKVIQVNPTNPWGDGGDSEHDLKGRN